jgi:hypothetical protein
MKLKRTFTLEKAASRSGGDRYLEQVPPGDLPMMGSTYLNQWVTRSTGLPEPELIIEVSVKE